MGTKNQILVLTLLSASIAAYAQAPALMPHPPGYVCVRADGAVAIDGRLDDPAWRTAAWTADFVDMAEPGTSPAPRTRVKMLWDDAYLYIGADIAEPHLWAEMTKHDAHLYLENAFEFFIDPDGDNHEYYEFEINALNTNWDLLLTRPYRDGGRGVSNWEIAGLKSAVHLDGTLNNPSDVDRGWTIELAVPWTALEELAPHRGAPREGEQWRVNFTRVETALQRDATTYKKIDGKPSQVSSWAPQYVFDIHRPETWGYVQFERAARPFAQDPSWPARRWLRSVYYAQQDYRKAYGRWARSLDDLGMRDPTDPALSAPRLETAADQFTASIQVGNRRWSIRQDSRIWSDPPAVSPQPRLARPVQHPRGYVSTRASAPLSIDGRLDDPAWREALWTDDFVDIEGDAQPKPVFRTRVKMLWDETYFYIGADLEEPDVRGTLRQHDSVIFRDNDFEFFIDPDGDNHAYYEFEMNALNTGWDLLLPRPYKDGGRAIDDWEITGLETAVHLDGTLNDSRDRDRGWSLEIAVPWTALAELAGRASPPREGDQWRVDFSRVEWGLRPSEHNWVWSPQHVVNMHRPETWGYVQFERGLRPFVPDPSWPARRWLHTVYYAQLDYRKAHGRWAATLADLGVAPPADAGLANPRIETTADLFQVSIDSGPTSEGQRWSIRADSLVWAGPVEKKAASRQQEVGNPVKPALRAEEGSRARR
jgi:Carbohydrate family 9 binding domain-like